MQLMRIPAPWLLPAPRRSPATLQEPVLQQSPVVTARQARVGAAGRSGGGHAQGLHAWRATDEQSGDHCVRAVAAPRAVDH
jgi:hypothetical protein